MASGGSGGAQDRALQAFLAKVFTVAELTTLELISDGTVTLDLARCAAWQTPARRGRILERIAARFAGKEAVLKALGTGLADGISWHEVEILTQASGAPEVRLTGRAAQIAANLGMNCWLISLSHTHEVAMASVMAGRR